MHNLTIKAVLQRDEKSRIVRDVLLDLPEWFGLPESTEEYIKDAQDLTLWAAQLGDEAIGFVSLTESSSDCGEVHCMGVKKKYHRMGIGKSLLDQLIKEASKKYDYLQVKTVDEGHYKEYDQTIAFYRNCGFRKLEGTRAWL